MCRVLYENSRQCRETVSHGQNPFIYIKTYTVSSKISAIIFPLKYKSFLDLYFFNNICIPQVLKHLPFLSFTLSFHYHISGNHYMLVTCFQGWAILLSFILLFSIFYFIHSTHYLFYMSYQIHFLFYVSPGKLIIIFFYLMKTFLISAFPDPYPKSFTAV